MRGSWSHLQPLGIWWVQPIWMACVVTIAQMRYRLCFACRCAAASTDTLIFLSSNEPYPVNGWQTSDLWISSRIRFPSVRSILERWRRSHGILSKAYGSGWFPVSGVRAHAAVLQLTPQTYMGRTGIGPMLIGAVRTMRPRATLNFLRLNLNPWESEWHHYARFVDFAIFCA